MLNRKKRDVLIMSYLDHSSSRLTMIPYSSQDEITISCTESPGECLTLTHITHGPGVQRWRFSAGRYHLHTALRQDAFRPPLRRCSFCSWWTAAAETDRTMPGPVPKYSETGTHPGPQTGELYVYACEGCGSYNGDVLPSSALTCGIAKSSVVGLDEVACLRLRLR